MRTGASRIAVSVSDGDNDMPQRGTLTGKGTPIDRRREREARVIRRRLGNSTPNEGTALIKSPFWAETVSLRNPTPRYLVLGWFYELEVAELLSDGAAKLSWRKA